MSCHSARIQFLAACMDDIVPWTAVCGTFKHEDWADLLVCMQQHSPRAFDTLYREFADPREPAIDGLSDPADRMDDDRDKLSIKEIQS